MVFLKFGKRKGKGMGRFLIFGEVTYDYYFSLSLHSQRTKEKDELDTKKKTQKTRSTS